MYVDDGLLVATDPHELGVFLPELRSEYKIVSRETSFFLGLEIEQKDGTIKISQKVDAKRILENFNYYTDSQELRNFQNRERCLTAQLSLETVCWSFEVLNARYKTRFGF